MTSADFANLSVYRGVWTTAIAPVAPILSKKLFYDSIPLAPRGVLAPVSAHAGPSAHSPLGTSGIFPAYVSAELPSNISTNPPEVISKDSELYNKSF